MNKYNLLLLILILFLFMYFSNTSSFITENFSEDKILINILTRTGNRDTCFDKLSNSINDQTFKNIRHLKSNDNTNCKFLEGHNDVFIVEKGKKFNHHHCPYNEYINELIDKVEEGWIMVLDDDAIFSDKDFINNLVNEIKKYDKKAFIFDTLIGESKRKLPNLDEDTDLNKIGYGNFDMSCFVFHSSLKPKKFTDVCGGDYIMLKNLLNITDVKYIKIPTGIWANYKGGKGGSKLIC